MLTIQSEIEKITSVPGSNTNVVGTLFGILITERRIWHEKSCALAKLQREVEEAHLRVESLSRAVKAVENAMDIDATDRRKEIVRLLEEVPGTQMRTVLRAIVRGLRQADLGTISNLSQSSDVILVALCHYVRDVWGDSDIQKVEDVMQIVLLSLNPDELYRNPGETVLSDDKDDGIVTGLPGKWQGLMYSTRRMSRNV